MINVLSDELKKKRKNFFSINNIFTTISITASFLMITSSVIPLVGKKIFDEKFWGNVNQEYNPQNLVLENLQENTKKLAQKNVSAEINTFNFVKSDKNSDSYISLLKESLLSDISYYKSKEYYPIDVKYNLSLFPQVFDEELKKQGKFKEITNYLLEKFIPAASFEKKTNLFNSSYSNINIGKNVNAKNFKYYHGKENLNDLNCQINIRHNENGSIITLNSLKEFSFNNLNLDNNFEKLPLKYSFSETKIFQEFVMLHEYFHCVTEAKSIQDNISKVLFGYSSSPIQSELSEYIYGRIRLRDPEKIDFIGNIPSPVLSRNFEKYVDTLATIAMINRYTNNASNISKEEIKALNTIISDFYSFRLRIHLISPVEIHVNYEIFNYLTKKNILDKISKLNTFDEINSLALEVMEKSNAWRLHNNKTLFYYDIDPFKNIEGIIKTITLNSYQNAHFLNKDSILNQLHILGKSNNYQVEIFNAVIDPLITHLRNKDNLSSDLNLIIQNKTTSFQKNLFEFHEEVSAAISDKYGVKLSKSERVQHMINYLDNNKENIYTNTLLDLLKIQNKAINMYENFINSNDPQNSEEESKELMKNFGTYYISYETLSMSYGYNRKLDKINADNNSLVLLNNFETEFLAYKHNIKSYELDIPSDRVILEISENINPNVQIDYELPPYLFIDKKLDNKLINILKLKTTNNPVKDSETTTYLGIRKK